MKSSNIVLIVFTVLVIVLIYSLLSSGDDESYNAEITRERKDRDNFMRTAKDSPMTDKASFTGLDYYPPDPKYKIVANLTPVENRNVVVLATSDGLQQRYAEYAYAHFSLDGVDNRLLIMEVMEMGPNRGKLFLAFADETSASETYGAGRYLDLNKVPGSSTITLDFNKAYNPYCAYNPSFSCPLPPRDNLLKVAIRAGEKTFH